MKAVTQAKYGPFTSGIRDKLLRKRRALYDFRRAGTIGLIRASIAWHLRYQYVGAVIKLSVGGMVYPLDLMPTMKRYQKF